MRDVLGIICFAAAIAAAITLVAILVRRRGGDGSRSRESRRGVVPAVAAACGALAAVAVALLVPPHYAITVQTKGEIVAQPASKLTAHIKNGGLLSGTFHASYALDGAAAGEVTSPAAAGATRTIDLPLPSTLAAGPHTLTIAGTSVAFRALRPAEFHVADLQLVPLAGTIHRPVVVTAQVHNTGEATGEFAGVLRVDGRRVQTKSVTLGGGDVKSVFFQVTRARPGMYTFSVGDSRPVTIPIVKPIRPSTGTVLARTSTGNGHLVFQNRMTEDCVVALAASAKGGRPALAFYVRAKGSATVTGIADGSLYVYYTSGSDWNRTTGDFLDTTDRYRFKRPVAFSTSSWTTSYTDWSAWMIYTTRHTRYTVWTIKVSDQYVWGPKGGVVVVGEKRFPKV